MAKVYSDIVKSLQSQGYTLTNRDIGYIQRKYQNTNLTKAQVENWYKNLQQSKFNIEKDLKEMINSPDKVKHDFAEKLLNDSNFNKTLNEAKMGKIRLSPNARKKFRSAKAYASHNKWKETLIAKFESEASYRITDPDLLKQIRKGLNDLSIFEYNTTITNAFDSLAFMYGNVQTTIDTFKDFLKAVHIIDDNTAQSEIDKYLSKFDINMR